MSAAASRSSTPFSPTWSACRPSGPAPKPAGRPAAARSGRVPMTRFARVPVAVVAGLLLAATTAHADRRYFVQSYTPYLAPSGNLEFEATSIALSGQGDSTATAWENRMEFEYGISDRLTGAFYLNFVQPAGDAPTTFDGPSLELIYQPVKT